MIPVSIAYCHLRFGAGGIEVELVFQDQQRKQLNAGGGQIEISLDRRQQLFDATAAAVSRACAELGIEQAAHLPVALTCPPGWREVVVLALSRAGCPEFELLSPEAAESVHFFDRYEAQLGPIMARWISRARESADSIEASAASARELELARDALANRTMSVAVVGAMKAGKSTFLNALLGDFVMPAIDKRCTRRRFVLSNLDEDGAAGRRVTVLCIGRDGLPFRDPILSLDADALGWSSAHILSYLFVLNAPHLLTAAAEPEWSERLWVDEYRRLPLSPEQRSALDEALAAARPIETIRVTHPFYALTHEAVGKVEIWDTPGPDSVSTDVVDGLDQRLHDRAHFEQALREASAAILIFDVMRNGGEAQDQVLADIKKFRGNRADSLLLLANRVDERPVTGKGVLGLDKQLDEIRENARKRHKLSLRPIVAMSARHAQYAREMLRGIATGKRDEERWIELERAIRTADIRADAECPARAVEARSAIRDVETLLQRFFRQEHGLSILQGACAKVARLALLHEHTTERNLAALRVEKEVLERAVTKLEAGTARFVEVLESERVGFSSGAEEAKRAAQELLRDARRACSESLKSYWEQVFGPNQQIEPEHYQQSSGPAMALLEPALTRLRGELQRACDREVATRAKALWSRIDSVVESIERDVDRQLGIAAGGATPRAVLDTDFAKVGDAPRVKPTSQTTWVPVETTEEAGWGTGLMLGLGALGTLLTGGLAVPAIALAAAAGSKALGGSSDSDMVTEIFYARADVLREYKAIIDGLFESFTKTVPGKFKGVFAAAGEEIAANARQKLATLGAILADAQKHASEPSRMGRIKFLEVDLAASKSDIQEIRDIGGRLGISVA